MGGDSLRHQPISDEDVQWAVPVSFSAKRSLLPARLPLVDDEERCGQCTSGRLDLTHTRIPALDATKPFFFRSILFNNQRDTVFDSRPATIFTLFFVHFPPRGRVTPRLHGLSVCRKQKKQGRYCYAFLLYRRDGAILYMLRVSTHPGCNVEVI